MTETTPDLVARKATEPTALALDQLTLIGLFSAGDRHAALIRNSRGDIARVEPGDNAFGLTIVAIDDSRLLLTDRNAQRFALEMPRG